jgi:hypothetical protein
VKLLKLLGFLPDAHKLAQIDEKLVQDLWILVKGELNEGVSLDTLRVVLLNVIGVRVLDREQTYEGETSVVEEGENAAPTTDIDLDKLAFFYDNGLFYL